MNFNKKNTIQRGWEIFFILLSIFTFSVQIARADTLQNEQNLFQKYLLNQNSIETAEFYSVLRITHSDYWDYDFSYFRYKKGQVYGGVKTVHGTIFSPKVKSIFNITMRTTSSTSSDNNTPYSKKITSARHEMIEDSGKQLLKFEFEYSDGHKEGTIIDPVTGFIWEDYLFKSGQLRILSVSEKVKINQPLSEEINIESKDFDLEASPDDFKMNKVGAFEKFLFKYLLRK